MNPIRIAAFRFSISICMLCSSIESAAQAFMVADIQQGTESSDPRNFIIFQEKLFFQGNPHFSNFEFWSYDGVDVQLELSLGDTIHDFSVVMYDGKLFMNIGDSLSGRELLSYDGTGIQIEADINVGPSSSLPRDFVVFNGALYFSAFTEELGREFWRFDGDTVNLVSDINPGDNSSNCSMFYVNGDSLFMQARGYDIGYEPWVFDGQTVDLIADLRPGIAGSAPTDFVSYQNKIYFSCQSFSQYPGFWSYDGDTIVNESYDGYYAKPIIVFHDNLIINRNEPEYGSELWSFDGDSMQIIANIAEGYHDSYPTNFIEFGNRLFFSAMDWFIFGKELRTFDGVEVNLACDINPGDAGSMGNTLVAFQDKLVFGANDGVHGAELWTFDTTALNIAPVTESKFYIYPNPTEGRVFIKGSKTAETPYELYSVTGRLIRFGILDDNSLNLADVASGVYLLRVGETVKKLLIH